jgi:3-oxoacyl-[acyl-carrier protein] reductase
VDLGLSGKTALVCAASKGLGKACARALAAEGASVAICARDRKTLDAAAAEISQAASAADARVLAIPADLSNAADVDRLLAETEAAFGGLDILVTNTGGPRSAPFEALSDEDWTSSIDSMLLSVVRLVRGVIPHMRRRGGGRIINVTSVSVKQPIDGLVLSNSLRAAVTGLSRTLANELARDNILVNCVAPGFTATDRVVELADAVAAREGTTRETVQRRTEGMIPLGRMGTPEEFGAVVAFLASPRASYVTGTTLQVDGGFVKSLL